MAERKIIKLAVQGQSSDDCSRGIEKIGNLCSNKENDCMSGRVYSVEGIAPTVDTVCRCMKILEEGYD